MKLKSLKPKHIFVYKNDTELKSLNIITKILKGESFIINDATGALYSSIGNFLSENGYTVRIFNLEDPEYSNTWNCLQEINTNHSQLELMAQSFAEIVVNHSPEDNPNEILWRNAEVSLLKAICLYLLTDIERPMSEKNLEEIYKILTTKKLKQMDAMFDSLADNNAAKKAWNVFNLCPENIKENIILLLSSKLQVLQSSDVVKATNTTDINFKLPALQKCAYFIIRPISYPQLDFLSELFYSFLYLVVVRYTNGMGYDGACKVPVNFVLGDYSNNI